MLRPVVLFLVLGLSGASLTAQSIDFTGTYRLDKAASQITPGAGLAGLGPGGMPNTLYLEHMANGSITLGSDMNEGEARLYRINASSTLRPAKGDPIAVTSRIDGRSLVTEGQALKEVIALSADGNMLTVSVTAGEAASTLTYRRMDSVDPCTAWPTPCRKF